jgi:hypothetical protein
MKPTFKNTHLAVEELLREPPAAPAPETAYLGPATVAAVSYKQVELDHPGGRCTARIAVAQSYAPVVGDTVLVISRGTEWYVIGVLEGTGTTTFTAPGDIEFHAPRGRIEMLAKEGVFLKSDLVEIVATKLELTARHLFERFNDATQWITETLHRRIGRMHTKVEGDYDLKAGRITELADDDVTIDGKTIHLG